MTSKISFSKLVKRTIKEQTSLIFASCVYTVIGVMVTVFELQHVLSVGYDSLSGTPVDVYIAEMFQPGSGFTAMIFSIILASLFAFAGLRHLHSKTQSDFYGSLPIKRRTQLTVIFTSCFVIFLLPLLVQYLVDIVAVTATGYISLTVLKNMAVSIFYQLVVYLLTWFTAALAVVLTGHIFIGLLGLAVFFAYFPVVFKYLIPTFSDIYFNTYADVYNTTNYGFYRILDYLSPVSVSSKLMEASKYGNSHILVITIAELLALAGFVYYLYEKRPAEAAGSSMAFPKWNTFWAILFIVPAALYSGLLFSSVAYGSQATSWIFPGTIVGVFIFAVIIEFLFDFDIKAVLHHKRRFITCFVLSVAFLTIFQFDFFGFDNWRPEKDQLESISFDYNGMSFASSSAVGRYVGFAPLQISLGDKKGMSGEDLDAAYDLAMSYAEYGNSSDYNSEISEFDDADGVHYQTVTVRYYMKNGQVKSRAYFAPVTVDDPLLQAAFEKEGFKDDLFIHYALTPDMIEKSEWYNGSDFIALNWNEEEKAKFLDAYKKDISALTLTELLTEYPVSTVRLNIVESDVCDSFIYRSFKNTAAFLSNYEIDATSYSFTEENIQKLVIQGIRYDNDGSYAAKKTISDKEQIKELLPYLVNIELCTVNANEESMINYDYNVEVHTQNSIFYTQITNKGIGLLDTFE